MFWIGKQKFFCMIINIWFAEFVSLIDGAKTKEKKVMSTQTLIILIIVLVLLFGGGGFWYRGRRR